MTKQLLTLLFFTTYISTGLCQNSPNLSQRIFNQKKDSLPQPVFFYGPKWSLNGKSIAFELTKDNKSAIYTISADGKSLKRITDTLNDYGDASWSPDGKYLVYYGDDNPMQLFKYALLQSKQQKLPTPGYDAYNPSWSVNNKIAFSSRLPAETPNDISIINSDGTAWVKLTDGKYNYKAPKWSPDGKKILFERSIGIRKPYPEITAAERKQMRAY